MSILKQVETLQVINLENLGGPNLHTYTSCRKNLSPFHA